ncbi:MAG: avidin/streptavidin family protein [Pseudomonadota bacterium]
MPSLLKALICFIGWVLIAAPGFAQEPDLADSVWRNQSGSYLLITEIDETGRFSGAYFNQASGYRCQGLAYETEGRVHAGMIGFQVAWEHPAERCDSLTVWAGRIQGDVITTRWLLARAGNGELLEGESRFERLEGRSAGELHAEWRANEMTETPR